MKSIKITLALMILAAGTCLAYLASHVMMN